MGNTFSHFLRPLQTTPVSLWVVYLVLYGLMGMVMNEVGQLLEIARFEYWWQIITVYLLYMVPVSILLRPYTFFQQYAYGLFFMGILELGGYALETSYAYPDNLIDTFLGVRNFALVMTLFFALYFPLGNSLASFIHNRMASIRRTA